MKIIINTDNSKKYKEIIFATIVKKIAEQMCNGRLIYLKT